MPAPNAQYYQAVAERKMNEIGRKFQYYTTQVNHILQSNDNVDQDLKLEMYNIRSYLNPLAGELSMDEAQWYINKVERLYNKAIRNYNKRLKKAQKK
jgi:hypothetical protein